MIEIEKITIQKSQRENFGN